MIPSVLPTILLFFVLSNPTTSTNPRQPPSSSSSSSSKRSFENCSPATSVSSEPYTSISRRSQVLRTSVVPGEKIIVSTPRLASWQTNILSFTFADAQTVASSIDLFGDRALFAEELADGQIYQYDVPDSVGGTATRNLVFTAFMVCAEVAIECDGSASEGEICTGFFSEDSGFLAGIYSLVALD